VIARAFLRDGAHEELPQVPSCQPCNTDKSRLELELSAVLPFGGVYDEATALFNENVPRRLARNARQTKTIAVGMVNVASESGNVTYVPLGSDLLELYALIARGLAWYHWRVLLDTRHESRAHAVTAAGERAFQPHLTNGVRYGVTRSVGNGAFSYTGMQRVEYPEFTAWRFSIYGGVKLFGGIGEAHAPSTAIAAVTAERSYFTAAKASAAVF
jgi:hypothetical protein